MKTTFQWRMVGMATATLAVAALGTTSAQARSDSFDRYQMIIDRKPFGDPPPAPAAPVVPFNPRDSFAASLRLSALIEQDDGSMRVGLIDMKSNSSFFLSVGESEEGIELVSASWEDEEAVLRKGSEMAVIKVATQEIQPVAPGQQYGSRPGGPPPGTPTSRPSYAERRQARLERRRAEPPPEPQYTGEELEKHLQEYQMEVIRQGLPPLPIPLTAEMDQQLVHEGVLPPME